MGVFDYGIYTPSPNMVKIALKNKAIKRLRLEVTGVKTEDMIDIISSLSDQSLCHLTGGSETICLTKIARRLPSQYRNSLQHIEYRYFHRVHPEWSVILLLPRQFTQLNKLTLIFVCLDYLTVNHITEMIVSYLNILLDNFNHSNSLKLRLWVEVLCCTNTGWRQVFELLETDHNCKIEQSPTEKGTFYIHCYEKGNKFLELNDVKI